MRSAAKRPGGQGPGGQGNAWPSPRQVGALATTASPVDQLQLVEPLAELAGFGSTVTVMAAAAARLPASRARAAWSAVG